MRGRDVFTHAAALTALFYAWRSMRVLEGWIRVPRVVANIELPALSIVVPARDENGASSLASVRCSRNATSLPK